MDIKNSSGKVIGTIEKIENGFIIHNPPKPDLVIDKPEIVEKINNKDESAFLVLWEEYTLLIGEIAALYDMIYATTRKHLIRAGINTNSHAGRRNSSYGREFSEERKRHIGEKSRGRIVQQYERTPEIREKISSSLKKYFSTHEISEKTRQKLSDAWARGCYEHSPMGKGYSGYFFSIKNQTDFYFRSFLELNFLLRLETEEKVQYYQVEPFKIRLENNHFYTPDVLINNSILIELKPSNHLNYEDKGRWELEQKGVKEFCENHNYEYRIVYDTDIDFETSKFKRWFLANQDELTQYNIRLSREIIWS